MIKAVLIDDEKQARNALRELIESHCPEVEIIAEADGVSAAVECIEMHKPQLVFLDINLGDGTGFHVLERLQFNDFMVIFTTAYDQYAVTAFKINALDYLLKPVNSDELIAAVEKAKIKVSSENMALQLELLKDSIGNKAPGDKKIVLKDSDSIYFIKVTDIVRCQAEGPYTEFFISPNQKITISKSLKEYEEMLEPFGFIRIHNSHLVNKNRILRFVKSEGGSVVMDNNEHIPVSQRRRDVIMEMLNL